MKYVLMLAIALMGGWEAAHAQRQPALLLKHATVIDGAARVLPVKASVLVRNGKIEKVYRGAAPRLRNVREIDCTGQFIMPGLTDAHVHLATGLTNDTAADRRHADSIMANMVRHGITTVRDMAGNAPFLRARRAAVRAGETTGPDIFFAAQFAGPEYFDLLRRSGRENKDVGTSPWYRTVYPELNIAKAVAEAKAAGVTGLKIYASLSAAQIAEITREAHRQGLLAWSHGTVFPSKPIHNVQAGVNSMSHANDLAFQQLAGDSLEIGKAWGQLYKGFKLDTAAQLALLKGMRQKGIFLDPTVFHATQNKMYNAIVITRLAHRQGVKVVTGTDWIYPTAGDNIPLLDEMKVLASQCGMSHLEVIEAATINSAAVCGLRDRGTVRPGQRADLLVLNADPRQNLNALFAPAMVIANGQVVQ